MTDSEIRPLRKRGLKMPLNSHSFSQLTIPLKRTRLWAFPQGLITLRIRLIIAFLFLAITPAILLALFDNDLLVAILHGILAALVGALVLTLIMRPIANLLQVAKRITAGDLWIQAPESDDEIGALARALNTMTAELRRTLGGMEQNIAERTAELAKVSEQMKKRANQLQTIAEVAHAIASIQDPDDLLQLVTELIGERFGFYHVGIFLLDKSGEWALLQAANSEGGQRMMASGYKIRVGQEGIVGQVTERGEPRIALDTGAEAIYLDNPDLPYTLSEIALPLKVGSRVIGALDVQSMEHQAFKEEDITLLTTLANQVAVAIENVRLFSETKSALAELQTLHHQYLQEAWATAVNERQKSGYAYRFGKLYPLEENQTSRVWEMLEGEQITPITTPNSEQDIGLVQEGSALIVPITVRGQIIGMLNLGEPAQDYHWTEEDMNLVKTVADQVGQALEIARLLEETQRRAERERLVTEITSKLRASNNPQEILQTAASELRRALGAKQARIIYPAEESQETHFREQPQTKQGSPLAYESIPKNLPRGEA